ncbi:MAG: DUF3179 domain-containing protein [Actinomycetota bacterium]
MRSLAVVLLGVVLVGACSAADDGGSAGAPTPTDAAVTTTTVADLPTPTSTTIEIYPDAIVRELRRQAAEPRPVPRSAIPPRHLDVEAFPEILVPRDRIVYGGAPPDGIPSIDAPTFAATPEVELDDGEAVVVVTVGGETKLYPIRILIRHEIVNDVIGGEPVAVTYCPLCNSAVSFLRTAGGTVLDFGTSGTLYRSALVMYDRQTESLWTHFDGLSVVGDLVGTQLELVSTAVVSWADARRDHGGALVLTGDDASNLVYGENPYQNTDQRLSPPRAFVPDPIDERVAPMARTVGVALDGESVALERSVLAERRVIDIEIAGRELVGLWAPGQVSAIQAETVAGGDRIGSVAVVEPVLDGRRLELVAEGDGFVDQDGTTWSILGVATSGPSEGRTLAIVPSIDTFWFAWSGYHPDTALAG